MVTDFQALWLDFCMLALDRSSRMKSEHHMVLPPEIRHCMHKTLFIISCSCTEAIHAQQLGIFFPVIRTWEYLCVALLNELSPLLVCSTGSGQEWYPRWHQVVRANTSVFTTSTLLFGRHTHVTFRCLTHCHAFFSTCKFCHMGRSCCWSWRLLQALVSTMMRHYCKVLNTQWHVHILCV